VPYETLPGVTETPGNAVCLRGETPPDTARYTLTWQPQISHCSMPVLVVNRPLYAGLIHANDRHETRLEQERAHPAAASFHAWFRGLGHPVSGVVPLASNTPGLSVFHAFPRVFRHHNRRETPPENA
jgi:hypothetical protein